jgi:hypothetical protein
MFSIDGLLAYRQGVELVLHHSIRFSPPLHWGSATFVTSKYGIGLSLLYLPTISALASAPGVESSHGAGFALLYDDRLYMVAVAPLHALLVAISAYLVGRLVKRLGYGDRAGLWAMVLYGVGSPALIYSRGDWSQTLTGLCWVAAIYAAIGFRDSNSLRDLLLASFALFYAVVTRLVDGALLFPFVLMLVAGPGVRGGVATRARSAAAVVGGLVLGLAVTGFVSWARYGSPFSTGYDGEGWTTPLLTGLVGSLISPGRGILWEFPGALLAVLGFKALWTSGRKQVALALAGPVVLELASTATWWTWWGGANWGLRLFVPALPLVAVLAGAGITTLGGRAQTWLPSAMLVVGLAFALPAVIVDLFSGLPAQINQSAANFRVTAYAPYGAWSGLHHIWAVSLDDHAGVDILWFRLSGVAGRRWMLPFALFMALAVALALRAAEVWRPRPLPGSELPVGKSGP